MKVPYLLNTSKYRHSVNKNNIGQVKKYITFSYEEK